MSKNLLFLISLVTKTNQRFLRRNTMFKKMTCLISVYHRRGTVEQKQRQDKRNQTGHFLKHCISPKKSWFSFRNKGN